MSKKSKITKSRRRKKISRPETRLRRKIIKFLNKKQPPYGPVLRVRDQCGPAEYGADLIVVAMDFFDKPRAYGIQIKVGDISCQGKPTNKIKELVGQAVIALGKSILVDEVEYKIDGFYIVVDGELRGKANDYLMAARIGIRSIHIIGKDSLKEMFGRKKPISSRFEET
ncbi:MAG: hypothetical protein JRI96_07450 [Deltaproteobacteria bacterium]|nr:hypothetical protein [Deltaproteobacteria bacterium]